MLQAWLSIGYIVLLAVLVLAFILWRNGSAVVAIAALVVGIPLWFGWEFARPTWTTGVITGTDVRRSDPDPQGNTTDDQYIYMRNLSDRGLDTSVPVITPVVHVGRAYSHPNQRGIPTTSRSSLGSPT